MINFCIFEDSHYKNLLPLTEARPIYTCLLGVSTLYDKFESMFGFGNITLHCRSYLKATLKEMYKGVNINNINAGASCFFYNGRVILNQSLKKRLTSIDRNENTLITYQGNVVAIYLKGDLLSIMIQCLVKPIDNGELIKQFRSYCTAIELETCDIINTPDDLIYYNNDYITQDFESASDKAVIKGEISPFTVIYNENNVFIDQHVNIEDFVVIDATKGPVYIENDVEIQAHSRLEGPLYVGHHTKILGGRISQSSIGSFCKVMGEVSNSIIESYTNKAHAGFLGHSYVGRWVNLGAHTTVSNLKNTYSPVTVQYKNKVVNTSRQFLGVFIGDFVKTSIGTLLNCGTVVSLGSLVFDHDISNKYYPVFSWGFQKRKLYDLDKFVDTMRVIMKRRNCELTQNQIDLFHFVKKNSSKHE